MRENELFEGKFNLGEFWTQNGGKSVITVLETYMGDIKENQRIQRQKSSKFGFCKTVDYDRKLMSINRLNLCQEKNCWHQHTLNATSINYSILKINTDGRWHYLEIRNITEEDEGKYLAKINGSSFETMGELLVEMASHVS